MRLAVLVSHPIQYHAPLLRELARRIDLVVFFGHKASKDDQASAGFGVGFDWDIDLLAGYEHVFLANVSRQPGTGHFGGLDTPELGERLAEGMFDGVLVMGWHLKSYWQGIWAAKRLGLPVMVRGDSHLETPRSAVKRAVKEVAYRPALRIFDAALYVGQKSKAYYEHYRYPRERLFFSPHCVDGEWFGRQATALARWELRNALRIPPEVKVVLFAGKLIPLKRPLDVIDAAAQCRARGESVEVMVAGAGALEGAMRERAAAVGIPLHMLGFRNQTQMPAAFAACDMLALTSDRETWGLVANEALGCGKPIIVTEACGCAPDLAADGAAGRVVPVGDASRLASAITDLIARPCRPDDIRSKSHDYSIGVATEGIVRAAHAVGQVG